MDISTKIIKGFTIIELILVILIISILSIIVLPKYLNLKTTSQINTTRYIAANLSSANASNYAGRIINPTTGVVIKNCRDASALLSGGLPPDYSIRSRGIGKDVTVTCTLNGPSSTTATFLATGVR